MKKRILLLGDSIRLGYQPEVVKALADDCEVWGPEDNCRFAKYTLNELDRIFTACGRTPDLIHWNNGLWDSAIVCAEDGMFTPPDEYEHDMRLVLRELRKRCPTVIFASTTPVKPGSRNQKLEYIQALNSRIIPVMNQEGVPVNDLYMLVSGDIDQIIGDDKIHLSEYGQHVVGRHTAKFIQTHME